MKSRKNLINRAPCWSTLAFACAITVAICIPTAASPADQKKGGPLIMELSQATAPTETVPARSSHASPSISQDKVVLPEPVFDPIEPFNRTMWGLNEFLLAGVVQPTSKAYRFVICKPLRTGVNNFGRNLVYPKRLINNLLQGKWTGARDETYRFLANTGLGVGGLFNMADKFEIPASDEDFGQTFGHWGWKPGVHLVLPILGPTNERDAIGLIGDTAANPLVYFHPYSYANPGIRYNQLSDQVDGFVRFNKAEKDPYYLLQYARTFSRKSQVLDYEVKDEPNPASLETLRFVFFSFKDPKFPERGRTRSVEIPATERELKFTYWLQPEKAPVVYIVPGMGHRLATAALGLAELLYEQGFSVVCVSSPFNYEFMERASTAALPGYTPADAQDLRAALSEIDRRLERDHPDRLGARALMGYSMGAFQTLFIAAGDSAPQPGQVRFDRYVAVNPPIRLLHGVSMLDEYYNAPLAWPAAERTDAIENTFLKVATLRRDSLTAESSLPFNAIESRFLIGLNFRSILRDVIYTSQQRHDMGVLTQPVKTMRREPLYREIIDYSYADYLEKFVIPYYQKRGIDLASRETMEMASDLRAHSAGFQSNRNVRLITNRNDFLLTSEDLQWIQSTFGPERLTLFDEGGHLGNLSSPAMKEAISKALQDLLPPAQGEEQPKK